MVGKEINYVVFRYVLRKTYVMDTVWTWPDANTFKRKLKFIDITQWNRNETMLGPCSMKPMRQSARGHLERGNLSPTR